MKRPRRRTRALRVLSRAQQLDLAAVAALDSLTCDTQNPYAHALLLLNPSRVARLARLLSCLRHGRS